MVICLQHKPTCVEASNSLGHDPLEVVDDGVGHGVRGDVLAVVGSPEGHHVLPQGSVPCEPAQPEEAVETRWLMKMRKSKLMT